MDDAERSARRERMRAALGPEAPEPAREADPKGSPASSSGSSLKKGCLWIAGGVFGLTVVGALLSDPPNSQSGQSSTEVAKALTAEETENVMRDWHKSIMATAKPCDLASKEMSNAMLALADGRGSTLAIYQTAKGAEDACRDASLAYAKLAIPSNLPDNVEKAIEATHETCSNGFVLRQIAAEKVAEIFDGAFSNSNITELQQMVKDGQSGIIACVGSSMKAVDEAGIEADAFAKWSDDSE